MFMKQCVQVSVPDIDIYITLHIIYLEVIMKRTIISIFILLTLSFGSISNIKRLQWIDPYGREPMKHSKWHKQYVDQKEPTKIVKVYCAKWVFIVQFTH